MSTRLVLFVRDLVMRDCACFCFRPLRLSISGILVTFLIIVCVCFFALQVFFFFLFSD